MVCGGSKTKDADCLVHGGSDDGVTKAEMRCVTVMTSLFGRRDHGAAYLRVWCLVTCLYGGSYCYVKGYEKCEGEDMHFKLRHCR